MIVLLPASCIVFVSVLSDSLAKLSIRVAPQHNSYSNLTCKHVCEFPKCFHELPSHVFFVSVCIQVCVRCIGPFYWRRCRM
uniref:Putative secreted protein n=1 Tax=Anopheles marajoara TaxID=58244 RepID=A0A2M4CBL3_9DIPT